MRLQEQLSNGEWVDAKEQKALIERILKFETSHEKFLGRAALKNAAEIEKYLSQTINRRAAELQHGTDFYDLVRDGDTADAIKAAWSAKANSVMMVMCSCGHQAISSRVMNASRGTSCPDCYDRMSE